MRGGGLGIQWWTRLLAKDGRDLGCTEPVTSTILILVSDGGLSDQHCPGAERRGEFVTIPGPELSGDSVTSTFLASGLRGTQ